MGMSVASPEANMANTEHQDRNTANSAASEVVLAVIRGRRSIRSFQERAVPREVLEQLLEAAIWAPSANNLQPWRFIVLQGERKRELAALLRRFVDGLQPGLNPVLWLHHVGLRRAAKMIEESAATVTVWAMLSPDDARLRLVARGDLVPLFSWSMIVQSVAAAVQNLLLAAHALGLGAVWLGYPTLAAPQIKPWLGAEGELMATIALGYPAVQPAPTPRKPLHSVVRWEG